MTRYLLTLMLLAPFAASATPLPLVEAPAVTKAESHIEQAREAMEAQKWNDAEKHLKKAKKLNPKSPDVYKLLGDFHKAFSRDHKAEKYFAKAKSLREAQAKNE